MIENVCIYMCIYIYIATYIYIYKWMQNINWRSLKALASRSRVFLSLINLYRALCNYTYITEKFDVECAMPVKLFLVVSVHTIIWLYWKAPDPHLIADQWRSQGLVRQGCVFSILYYTCIIGSVYNYFYIITKKFDVQRPMPVKVFLCMLSNCS